MHEAVLIVEGFRDDDRIGTANFRGDQAVYEFSRACLERIGIASRVFRGARRLDNYPAPGAIRSRDRQKLFEFCSRRFLLKEHLLEIPTNIAGLRVCIRPVPAHPHAHVLAKPKKNRAQISKLLIEFWQSREAGVAVAS